MAKSTRLFLFVILFCSCVTFSCSKTNRGQSGLTAEEIAYYTKLKEDYYKQRFLNPDTKIYDARKARNEDISEPSPFSVDTVEIDSISDLTVHCSYYHTDETNIVNFLYKGQGDMRDNGWFEPSISHFIIKDNDKQIDISFSENIYSPEVYYRGTFYYLHEAYELGIYSLDNQNIVITRNESKEIEGHNISIIEGYMPSTLINY